MKRWLFLVFFASLFAQNTPDLAAYSKAYDYVVESKWAEAAQEFRLFTTEYSESRYAGIATFWLAYSLSRNKEYYTAFTEYKNAFSNFNLNKEMIDRSKQERLLIAFYLHKADPSFQAFLDYGADYSDEIVVSLNKKSFHENKLEELQGRYKTLQEELSEGALSTAERKAKESELATCSEQIKYYGSINEKVIERLERFSELLKIDEDDRDERFKTIISHYEEMNKTYFDLISQVNAEDWAAALETSEIILKNNNNAKHYNNTLYWNGFIQHQIALKNDDENALKALFLHFNSLADQMRSENLKFECRVNRIMIAKHLAKTDVKYRFFLEHGADFKIEIRKVYTYLTNIQNPVYFKKISQLFRFDEVQIALQNAKMAKKALGADYDSKFVDAINKFADNLHPYYGSYQIDLANFKKSE